MIRSTQLRQAIGQPYGTVLSNDWWLRPKLGVAVAALESTEPAYAELLHVLGPDVEATIDEVRSFARGIHPPPAHPDPAQRGAAQGSAVGGSIPLA
jgi:hypothetical protein